MHEEQFDVLDVVDEEGLVARGHHVAGLLVGAITDLEYEEIAIENVSLNSLVCRVVYPSTGIPIPPLPPKLPDPRG